MATPRTLTFGKMLIEVGDGESPEQFDAPCGLTSKGFNQSATTQETTVPDCDDPDAAAYVERDVESLSSEISGAGVLAMDGGEGSAFHVWRGWYEGAAAKNVKITLDDVDGGYYLGAFHLTQFNIGATRGQKVTVDVTMVSDGEWSWVDAA